MLITDSLPEAARTYLAYIRENPPPPPLPGEDCSDGGVVDVVITKRRKTRLKRQTIPDLNTIANQQ